MTSFFKRALSIALVLCTLATLASAFSLFAEENTDREFLYRETFSGETVNTSGNANNITKANGTFVCVGSGSTFSLENGTLKYLTRVSGDYIDIRQYLTSTPNSCEGDFVLSVWIKPDVDNLSMTGMVWKQNGFDDQENGIFQISKGYYKINDTVYNNAQLVKDQWSLVEVVFHYDATAEAVGGEQGAFTYYTFMLNGELVKDADGNVVETPATYFFHSINSYRLFRYAGTSTYEMDDLTIACGAESLINIPRTDPNAPVVPEEPADPTEREFYFRETYSSGSINTSGSKANCIAANGLFVCHENGSTYTLENGTLKYLTRASKDYTDIRFYYDETVKDCTNDFILSFWIKPDVDNFKMTTFTWKQYSADVQENGVFKITDGYYTINDTQYKSAKLNKDEWALVEIVFHYDETATAVTGETGATTYYTFMLNGETLKDENGNVVEAPATYYFHNIDRYRMLQWAYGTYELDDLSIAKGAESLINIPRTAPETPEEPECEHTYDNACDKDCNTCGTVRETPDHVWNDATCTDPKTCSVCGTTEGEALGHSWYNATCTDPKTCSVCGTTEGEALGHSWYNATCTDPKTCSVCGTTEGEAFGHAYDNALDADCNVCGEIREVEIVTSGQVSTKIFWSYENGVLSITGKGKIKNFSAGTAPWAHLDEMITEVVIGEGITYIGSSAFYGLTAMVDVELPSTLTAIGNYAFYGCSKLTGLSVPANVTEIGAYAFRKTAIDSVDFAIYYGWSAGDNAFAIDELVVDGAGYLVKGFYNYVWTRDVNAEEEVLDDFFVDSGICVNGIKWIVTLLENGKMKLTITGDGAMPEFSTAGAPWYEYASEIVEIEVTETVTAIGRCSFYGLRYVTKVTIADSVTAINDYAFYMCKALKEIVIPEGATVGNDVFVKTGIVA